MASEKRDFKEFSKFPGNVVNDIYVFPPLYYITNSGKKRVYKIFIRIVKDNNRQTKINWNLLTEDQIPIKKEYFSTDKLTNVPDNAVVQLWNETGLITGKITRSIPSYNLDNNFIGNKNERNSFQVALIEGRSKFLKKKEEGGSESPDGKKSNLLTNVMHFPMLAKPWDKGNKHLKYPLYVQPKLDGVRCLVFLKNHNGGVENVIVYTRRQKIFPEKEYLKEILYPYLNKLYDVKNDQSIFLDGELYGHGTFLQDITSKSRNLINSNNVNDYLKYHIYDCFYPKELNNSYDHRLKQLNLLFSHINKAKKRKYKFINIKISPNEFIKQIDTYKVESLSEGKKLFNKLINNNYEGAMFRNIDGKYLAHPTKTSEVLRSNNLVKMKKKGSDEYEVIDYKGGKKGKDVNAIIWICKTKAGDTFSVTPKDMTYEKRYEIFSDAEKNFNKKYKNRMLTVEYDDLSKKGIPLRAKGVWFRDYE